MSRPLYILSLLLMVWVSSARAADAPVAHTQPPAADMEVIAVMEILQMMDLAEQLDLVTDLDYLIEEEPHEPND
jgi:hypothetical protein